MTVLILSQPIDMASDLQRSQPGLALPPSSPDDLSVNINILIDHWKTANRAPIREYAMEIWYIDSEQGSLDDQAKVSSKSVLLLIGYCAD